MSEELEQLAEVDNNEDQNINTEESGEQPEEGGESGQDEHHEGGEESVIATFGDDAPDPEEEQARQAPEWVKNLRKTEREKTRRIKELEEQLKKRAQTENKPVQLSAKPTLEECDYDTDAYEQKLTAWYEQKRKVDEEASRAEAEVQQANQKWQSRLDAYGEGKVRLNAKDFDDAESLVTSTLSDVQRGLIVQGAKDSAALILALGRNPTKLKELAAIADPVEFAWAAAQLDGKLKVTTSKKSTPAPEKPVRGNQAVTGSVDSQLEKLRAEAERTGDRSKVIAYMRKQKMT